MKYKGVLLAGGNGTRLDPLTKVVSKQLLPVYDKPMIYYPLSVLMLAGINEILIITKPEDQSMFEKLLGDGSQWGVKIQFKIQPKPAGIAQGLIIAEDFLDGSNCVFILGDNIFYGSGLSGFLKSSLFENEGATIFTYQVSDPERYGVIEFDSNGKISKIIEKPNNPPSKQAVTGIYVLDGTASSKAKSLKSSKRGELEITDLLNLYLNENQLTHKSFNRGVAWLDTGTPESLLQAASYVETIEKRQGFKIACLEEISHYKGWMTNEELERAILAHGSSSYGKYLKTILQKT